MKQTTNLVSEILETLCHLEGALVPFLKTSFPFFCHLLTLLRIWVTLWTPVEVTTMELVDGLALPAKIKIVRLLNPVFGPVQSKGYENNNLLVILVTYAWYPSTAIFFGPIRTSPLLRAC